jgi:hypothetical protein
MVGVVRPLPNPQAGGPPPVSCLLLLIQYISSYPPYLEASTSICNLKACHDVVTRDPHVWLAIIMYKQIEEICKHKT